MTIPAHHVYPKLHRTPDGFLLMVHSRDEELRALRNDRLILRVYGVGLIVVTATFVALMTLAAFDIYLK